MPDFITLSCPSCGYKLQITEDIDRFACVACGNEHIINRSGGIVTLKPVIDSIKSVQVGVDRTASEVAIVRLKQEIKELESEYSTADDALKEALSEAKLQKAASDDKTPWKLIIVMAVVLTIILLIIPGTRNLGVYASIFTGLFSLTVYIINSGKGSAGIEKEELERLENKALSLQNKLELKKIELLDHQRTVSRYD